MNTASQNNTLTLQLNTARFIPPGLGIALAGYFLASFFSHFYPFTYQFILLNLLFQAIGWLVAFPFLTNVLPHQQVEWRNRWMTILIVSLSFFLAVSAILISWQFPELFDRELFFMEPARVPLFALVTILSTGNIFILRKLSFSPGILERLKENRVLHFLRGNVPGILLATFFLATYLIFAQTLNFPGFRTLDQFFDMDISDWLTRFARVVPQDVSMVRAVHPAVLLFLRPWVWFFAFFLHQDRVQAVFLMNAIAGAGCVFLAWLIVKKASGNTVYALLFASILGASCAHLLLGSMLETYIYSALALLFFFFLLQNENTSLKATVPVGIIVFGITITNIIQTCILYFMKSPRIKTLLKYVLLVVFVTALLNVIQVWLYPENARSVFIPSNLLNEQKYGYNPFDLSWRTTGRFSLMMRALLLYGIAAPKPFILTRELGMIVPNFRTFQITGGEFHVAGYAGLADITIKFWMVILLVSGSLFLLDLFKRPKHMALSVGLLFCLGFNFALHMVYGDDPLLYSPNWVYALVLFVAFSLQKWADRKWLQLALTLFLVLQMSSNLMLIYQIMKVSVPFYG